MASDLDRQMQRVVRRVGTVANRVPEIARLTINRSVALIRTRVAREVARDTKLPLKTFKKKIYNLSAAKGSTSATLVMYRQGVTAGRLFTASRLANLAPGGSNRRGVSARGYSWPGAFVNVPRRTGKPLVMQRKGRARYPLEVIKIPVKEPVDRAYQKHSREVMSGDFHKILQQNMRYKMGGR